MAEAASHNPDIVLLDLGLPDIDGVEVIRRIRSWSNMPIIVISARAEDNDKIEALDAGADDYLTNPFRRGAAGSSASDPTPSCFDENTNNEQAFYQNGLLRIDYSLGCAYLGGDVLSLTAMEYKLLCLFARNTGRVLTHKYILQNVWGSSWENDIGTLRVFMATLRKSWRRHPALHNTSRRISAWGIECRRWNRAKKQLKE